MENQKIDISVVVPIYNEEKIIPELYDRLKNTVDQISPNYELIFVNDGSKDNSFNKLIKLTEIDNNVFYINFSRNFGHQIAVTAGLDLCRGKAVAIIDGDLQDPPEVILEMHEKYKEGYEVVYGQREKRDGESWFKKITAKMFYRLIKNITNINIPIDTGDFRLIDRKIVDILKKMPEQNKFLRGQIAWMGFRQTRVLFHRHERKYGKTGYPFSKMLKFAIDGVTSFSDKPLQLVTKLGLTIFCISFLVILYALFSYFVLDRTISGWTSIIICTAFFGGIQIFTIGIIGEYINRINKNSINRPLYIIDETNLNT